MSKVDRDAIKAAGYTALWVFVAMFATSLLGWLGDVTDWATDESGAIVFPDPAVLVKAIVAAFVAGFSFLVAAIVRLGQAHDLIPGSPPVYVSKPDDG